MARYAVGDVQGCHGALLALLERVSFDPARDRLLLAGDLVNRGRRSADVLRLVAGLGPAALTVLGNHDLHLLAVAAGAHPPRRKDTLGDVLDAPDRDRLLGWLRRQPLVHREPDLALVHAGLPPQWTVAEAAERAAEVEAALRGPRAPAFLRAMYGDRPARWRPDLEGDERLRYITNALTRIRFVDAGGGLVLGPNGPPGSQPPGLVPWYAAPARASAGEPVAFGHWSTLRLGAPAEPAPRVYHLDTGCVWGGDLTALRLEDRRWVSVPGALSGRGAAPA